MRAAIFRNGEIVVDQMPEPRPGPGMVLVKSLACGICGSTCTRASTRTAWWNWQSIFQAASRWTFRATSCSAMNSAARCSTMARARREVQAWHQSLFAAGAFDRGRPPGHRLLQRQYRRVCRAHAAQRSLLLEVPNGLAAEHAALTEPLAVGVHAVAKANIRGGEVPLVIGCGPVGLAVIAALKIGDCTRSSPLTLAGPPRARRKARRRRGRRPRAHATLCDLGRARPDVAARKKPRVRRCRRCCRRSSQR